jgi:hypothetical protein
MGYHIAAVNCTNLIKVIISLKALLIYVSMLYNCHMIKCYVLKHYIAYIIKTIAQRVYLLAVHCFILTMRICS